MLYDALDRVVKVTQADGTEVETTYEGESIKVADEADRTTKRSSDALGRLIELVEAPGVNNFGFTTSYGYDDLDNLISVTQANANRSFGYDSWKRLRQASNIESGLTKYRYDDNGNLIEKEDALNRKICHGTLSDGNCTETYDALNRVTRKSYSDGTPAVVFCYDGQTAYDLACAGSPSEGSRGRLSGITSFNGSNQFVSRTNFVFDPAGRLTLSEQKDGSNSPQTVQYTYYTDDSPATLIYPSGRMVTTCYDDQGRAIWLSKSGNEGPCVANQQAPGGTERYALVSEYHPQGAPKQVTLGNGLVESYGEFDRLIWPTLAV